MYQFFNLCFVSGLNPSDWDYSDIKPIPKPDKDARDPLQNRCITLMCCVAKIYSSILNRMLQTYIETINILVNKQNGLRASRSCIEHIFVLVSVLRNRKELGKETFLAFIFMIETWCKKWRLEVNLTKTNSLHIRSKRKPQSKFTFLFDMKPVPYFTFYKYLGVNIHEYLDFQFTVEKHSEAAGRALGSIVTKMEVFPTMCTPSSIIRVLPVCRTIVGH